jgi:tetratricopeptide (TPR) repeat protein
MAHTRRPKHIEPESQTTRSDWQALVASVRERPLVYIAGLVFVAAVVVLVALVRQVSERRERLENAAIARALDHTDPVLKLDALRSVAASDHVTADALYLLGEAAFDQQRYDEAREAFERVRRDYPQSEHVPAALEGIADVAYEDGQYEEALVLYEEIRQRWPRSFEAHRQLYNIGQAHERLNNVEAAAEAYREQITVFSGSTVAAEAQQALDRLRLAHPDLFPAEAPAIADGPGDPAAPLLTIPVEPLADPIAPLADPDLDATAPDAAPETVDPDDAPPVDSAPVEEAPVDEAPVDEAPVDEAAAP